MKTKINNFKMKEAIKYFFEVPMDVVGMSKADTFINYLWLRGYKIVPIEDEIR